MSARKKKTALKETFKVGDLVAAKIRGYPFWPGRVEVVDTKITVKFFSTNDTACSFQDLKPFNQLTEKERLNPKKGFQEALRICQELYDNQVKGSNDSAQINGDDEQSDDNHIPSLLTIEESGPTEPKSVPIKKEKLSPLKNKHKVVEEKIKKPPTTTVKKEKSVASNVDELNSVKKKIRQDTPIKRGRRSLRKCSESAPIEEVNEIPLSQASKISPTILSEDDNQLQKSNKRIRLDIKEEIPANKASETSTSPKILQVDEQDNDNEKFQITVAKLKKKIELKEKEKEACKTKKKFQKQLTKTSKKLVLFNKNLKRFSIQLKKIVDSSASQTNIDARLSNSIKEFPTWLKPLDKCISTNECPWISESDECRQYFEECSVNMKSIDENLKKLRHYEHLPTETKKGLKKCRIEMNKNKLVKQLAVQGYKQLLNAMIEVKENEAKKQK